MNKLLCTQQQRRIEKDQWGTYEIRTQLNSVSKLFLLYSKDFDGALITEPALAALKKWGMDEEDVKTHIVVPIDRESATILIKDDCSREIITGEDFFTERYS